VNTYHILLNRKFYSLGVGAILKKKKGELNVNLLNHHCIGLNPHPILYSVFNLYTMEHGNIDKVVNLSN
jgi:hypothetical protein